MGDRTELETNEAVRVRLVDTMAFAARDGKRFKEFISTLNYCIRWGSEGGYKRTLVKVETDFEPHSFVFYIWNYSYNHETHEEEKCARPFCMGMIYDVTTDTWGTHS